MQRDLEEFESRDAKLVAIGMGTGEEASALAERLGLGFPLLGDPEHRVYDAFGLGREGWLGLMLRPVLENPLGAFRDIAGADLMASINPRSDVKRLGGEAIVDSQGVVRWLHRAERIDDIPPNATLLAALAAL
ncbi:MAG: redoxin domain-containing protein [Deltaproteobacteria bacterium]|nr:redoxin domain-containing protein [Deltaproteobacteria bacterium]